MHLQQETKLLSAFLLMLYMVIAALLTGSECHYTLLSSLEQVRLADLEKDRS